MLGKLLKYELKASSRTLLPLYIGTLIVAGICSMQVLWLAKYGVNDSRIWVSQPFFKNGALSGFTFLLFFILCAAIMLLTAVIVIQRFNKSLIGDEGYLMFTLPVTHVQLLNSKLIAGLIWVGIGTFVMGLSAMLIFVPMFIAVPEIDLTTAWNDLQYLMEYWQLFLSITVSGIVNVCYYILVVYLSIMVGQMEQFNQHRVVISVLSFFLINWLFQLLETGFFQLFGMYVSNPVVVTLFGVGVNSIGMQDTIHQINQVFWFNSGITFLQAAICFISVLWLMKKKLNL